MTRLPAAVEATGVIRRAQAAGDFAAVIRRGDPDRGAIMLLVTQRGQHLACLERTLAPDGNYRWQRVGPGEGAEADQLRDFLARRARFDEDSWLIELDIADGERFIAETTLEG